MDWEDSLPTLDLADIPPFYPDADAGRNVEAGIDEDLRHARRAGKRQHRSMESDVFEFLHGSLTSKGHRAVAIRSHAKILLFEMTNRAAYVVESSANLRSCHNIEQFCLTHDAELLRFHRDWMDEVIERCERQETK